MTVATAWVLVIKIGYGLTAIGSYPTEADCMKAETIAEAKIGTYGYAICLPIGTVTVSQ